MEKQSPIAALILAAGVVLAAATLGNYLLAMKQSDRAVTVRGLNEREVKANLATWTLRYRASGDDLAGTQAALETQRETLIAFLKEQGFEAEELSLAPLKVTDRQSQDYNSNAAAARYTLQGGVMLRTKNVDAAARMAQKTEELVKAGVTLSDENYCGNSPSFLFTSLNDVKPDMLKEATQNARDSAQQFANDSGAQVGGIKRATQGYFSISGRDSDGEAGQGGGDGCADNLSLMKKIRVVTTVEYYLE